MSVIGKAKSAFTGKKKAGDMLPGREDIAPGNELVADSEGRIAAPPSVLKKIRSGESKLNRWTSHWRELWAFFDGDQFVEVSAVNGELVAQETREGGDKPRWRPRLTTNRYTKAIAGEVAVLTSRFPVYECTPLNHDDEKVNGARTSEKVLLHLHDRLRLRNSAYDVVLNAAVTGDGYSWPVWDSSVGDPIEIMETDPETGENVNIADGLRTGEIKIHELRQDQIMWPAGVKFEDAKYWIVRLVRPLDDVKADRGYIGPQDLASDAAEAVVFGTERSHDDNLVFEYHYLERPSFEHPQGRWLQIANDCVIKKPAAYPRPSGAPCIHRLPWIDRGTRRQRGLGLGEMCIDVQRRINRIINQIIAWRNLCLNPQMLAPEGSLIEGQAVTDEPGLVIQYRGTVAPTWRTIPEIPQSLFQDLDKSEEHLDYMVSGGASGAVVTGIESGDAYAAINEREQSFRSMTIANISRYYSAQGEHLLELVAKHYTEERMIDISGRFGVETIANFLGEWIEGTIMGVRVSEGSIAPRTRAQQEAKIMAFADKGWIPPHVAMAHLNGGTADSIIADFEADEGKVKRQIQGLVRLGSDPELQAITDPVSLIPIAGPQDNHMIFVDVISKWMKTIDFERQPQAVQVAAYNWLAMHEMELLNEQMQEAQRASANAESLGAENAGKEQEAKKEPSRPSIAHEAAALAGGGQE